MNDIETRQLFDISYGQVLKTPNQFIEMLKERFLECAINQSIEITVIPHHEMQKLLKSLVVYMIQFADEKQNSATKSRLLDIMEQLCLTPERLNAFVDSLLSVVESLDRRFDDAVKSAWMTILTPGISYLLIRTANRPVSHQFT